MTYKSVVFTYSLLNADSSNGCVALNGKEWATY